MPSTKLPSRGKDLKCPHCGARNKTTRLHFVCKETYGNAFLECISCKKAFVWCDGDNGDFVRTLTSEEIGGDHF